jgi:hypothetical protein
MKHVFSSLFVVASIALASTANAHFVWAVVDPGSRQIRLEVAESPGVSIAPMLGKLIGSMKLTSITGLVDETDHKHVKGSLDSKAGAVQLTYGIHGTDFVVWTAKGAANLEAAGAAMGLPFEILLSKSKKGLVAIVKRNGKPVSGALFEAYFPGASKSLMSKTSSAGTVELPTVSTGLLAVSAVVVDPKAGEYQGKPYSARNDMVSLTVQMGHSR